MKKNKILSGRFFQVTFLCTSIFLSTFLSGSGQTKSVKDLMGKWYGEREMFMLEFIDTANLVMTTMGKKQPQAAYILDLTKSPGWLDIFMGSGKMKTTIKSIIEFVDDETIRWQMPSGIERPNEFSNKPGSAVLTLKRNK